jgi:hypothetical protein
MRGDSAIAAAQVADDASEPQLVTTLIDDRGTRQLPQLVYVPASPSTGNLLLAWLDTNPLAVRALRCDAALNSLGAPFSIAAGATAQATSTPTGGGLRVTPPAALASLSSGATLAAYDLLETIANNDYSRVHYATIGLRSPGEPCSTIDDCASGICTGGVCCATACDGVCEACSARGCVETPASDARCGQSSCASLSTDCRSYDDEPARCQAFHQCAPPVSSAACTRFTDAPDGTPCSAGALGGAASGVCLAGSCVLANEPVAPAPDRGAAGCEVARSRSRASPWWLLVALAWLAARRRRALALLVLSLAAPARATPRLGPDTPADPPVLAGSPGNQASTAIAYGAGEYLQVWRDPGIDLTGVAVLRGARLAPDGTLLDPVPIVIEDAGTVVAVPAVGFDGARFLVVWQENTLGGGQPSIYADYVDTMGLPDTPFVVDSASNGAILPAVAGGNGHAGMVWIHNGQSVRVALFDASGAQSGASFDVATSTSLYQFYQPAIQWSPGAQRFLVAFGAGTNPYTPTATQIDLTGAFTTPFAVSTVNNTSQNPFVATDGTDFLVTWGDSRLIGFGGNNMFARLVPASGMPAAADFAVSQVSAANGDAPQATFVAGDYLVAWPQNNTTSGALVLDRVTTAGSVLDGDGVSVASGAQLTFPFQSRRGALATDGTKVMAAFTRYFHEVTGSDTFAMLIDPANLAAPGPQVLTSRGANAEYSRSLASDGNIFLVVWSDDRNVGSTGLDVLGLRVAADGRPIDAQPFYVCQAPGDQTHPTAAAAPGSGEFLVVWEDANQPPTELRGTRVPATGAPLDGDGFLIHPRSLGMEGRVEPTVAARPGGWLVAWNDLRNIYGSSSSTIYSTPEVWSAVVAADTTVAAEQAVALPGCDPAAIWDGASFFVAFENPCTRGPGEPSAGSGVGAVYGRFVDATGAVGFDEIALGTDPTVSQHSPQLSAGPGGVIATWVADPGSIYAALVPDGAQNAQTIVQLLSGKGTRSSPSVAYAASTATRGDVLFTWIDSTPLGVRGLLTDAMLTPVDGPFAIIKRPPVQAVYAQDVLEESGMNWAHALDEAPPAAVAALSSGAALIAYDLLDPTGSYSYPRLHVRAVGLRGPGEPCASQADCAGGICTGGTCCAFACDGVCEACSARGCVETPASDARCDGPSGCAALSTDCRKFDDQPAGRCEAFGRCAPPGGECTSWLDAPDGTPCSSSSLGGAPDGVCMAGSCALVREPIAPAENRATPGCALAGSGAAPWPLLLVLLLARRRRR